MPNMSTPHLARPLVHAWRRKAATASLLVLAAPSAASMEYHDNVVRFDVFPAAQVLLVGGDFTVREHLVTAGQDPSDEIRDGTVLRLPASDPTMNFRAGRHPSAAVADWFKQRVPVNGYTFGDPPKQLNFAVRGQLHLVVTHTSRSPSWTTEYTVEDIVLAQGSQSDQTNWWFGGKSCKRPAGQTSRVVCKATAGSGLEASLTFKRGDNARDQIQLVKITPPRFDPVYLEREYVGEQLGCTVPRFRCPPYVTYLTKSGELEPLKLATRNGDLVDFFGKPFDTREGDLGRDNRPAAIFVVTLKGEIYASIVHVEGLVHHSSLINGGAVAAAGEISVNAGRIVVATAVRGTTSRPPCKRSNSWPRP